MRSECVGKKALRTKAGRRIAGKEREKMPSYRFIWGYIGYSLMHVHLPRLCPIKKLDSLSSQPEREYYAVAGISPIFRPQNFHNQALSCKPVFLICTVNEIRQAPKNSYGNWLIIRVYCGIWGYSQCGGQRGYCDCVYLVSIAAGMAISRRVPSGFSAVTMPLWQFLNS